MVMLYAKWVTVCKCTCVCVCGVRVLYEVRAADSWLSELRRRKLFAPPNHTGEKLARAYSVVVCI